jgi:hypothetical protein
MCRGERDCGRKSINGNSRSPHESRPTGCVPRAGKNAYSPRPELPVLLQSLCPQLLTGGLTGNRADVGDENTRGSRTAGSARSISEKSPCTRGLVCANCTYRATKPENLSSCRICHRAAAECRPVILEFSDPRQCSDSHLGKHDSTRFARARYVRQYLVGAAHPGDRYSVPRFV